MVESRFIAVQDDPASFCMDWPVIDHRPTEKRFEGAVFVLDATGLRVGDAPMRTPGDTSADHALRDLGWARTDDWRPDGFGRPTAGVERRVVGTRPRLPVQAGDSSAEDASLYLG